jgi:tRNA pseudouridine55 synthase
MATGVLVVGVNRATRLLSYIVGTSKTYTATIRLGQSTVTDDAEGEVVSETIAAAVTEEQIREGAARLTGEILQVPSSVSAIKIAGQRSYARVRAGESVELEARPITVHSFEIHDIRRERGGRLLDVDATIRCSSGTYIRALARDLGADLGVGGHLTALRRTQVGPYRIDAARTLEELAEDLEILPLAEAARALLPARELSPEEAIELSFGRRIAPSGRDDVTAAFGPDGRLVALLKDAGPAARPELVFAAQGGDAKGEQPT